jgi:transposase
LDRTASELRSFASKFGDGAQVRRLLAIALVLDGHSRAEAAKKYGIDRQTLSDWVHRYNATGIDGLKSCHSPGATPLLSAAEKAQLQ